MRTAKKKSDSCMLILVIFIKIFWFIRALSGLTRNEITAKYSIPEVTAAFAITGSKNIAFNFRNKNLRLLLI